jgi:quinol---cytochrome c reductase iron-sulfur subunit
MPDDDVQKPRRVESVDFGRRRSGFPAAMALLLAMAAVVGFVVAYVLDMSTYWLGGSVAVFFAAMGFALGYWGRNLIGDKPATDTYPIPAHDDEARDELSDEVGSDLSVLSRRKFLTLLLGGAVGLAALSQVVLLGSFWRRPDSKLFHTAWKPGRRVVTEDGRPVTVDRLPYGRFLVAFPEGADEQQRSSAQIVLLRFRPGSGFNVLPGRETWSPEGFVAYSRVCTHAGCPVTQYEDENHLLMCPCHQSTFDVLNGAKPVFGPAGRPLPQLPLRIDANGFLVARSDFTESIGPGFWNQP